MFGSRLQVHLCAGMKGRTDSGPTHAVVRYESHQISKRFQSERIIASWHPSAATGVSVVYVRRVSGPP
jgi:hypothetical protein